MKKTSIDVCLTFVLFAFHLPNVVEDEPQNNCFEIGLMCFLNCTFSLTLSLFIFFLLNKLRCTMKVKCIRITIDKRAAAIYTCVYLHDSIIQF